MFKGMTLDIVYKREKEFKKCGGSKTLHFWGGDGTHETAVGGGRTVILNNVPIMPLCAKTWIEGGLKIN